MSDPIPTEEISSNAGVTPCLTAVMPVYNEGSIVAEVIQRVLAQRPIQELIIVDDASRDNTWEILKALHDPRVKIIQHPWNQGKGAAIRTGLTHARAPFVVIQDAD